MKLPLHVCVATTRRWQKHCLISSNRGAKRDKTTEIPKKIKIAYVVSGGVLALSLFSLSFQGLNQGVDFVGGRSYTVRFDQIISPSEIQSSLVSTLGSAEVKTFGEENQLKITTNYKVDVEGLAVDNEIQNILYKLSLFSMLNDQQSLEIFLHIIF